MSDQIIASLNMLASLQAKRVLLDGEVQAMKDAILTPELRAQVSAIDEEFAEKYRGLGKNIDDIETEIKNEVLTLGTSVKGELLQAVLSPGRVTWNTKALEGFMTAFPELAKFRKEGLPSVAIRRV